jgi:hypothetical protein
MENHSAANAAEMTTRGKFCIGVIFHSPDLLDEGLSHFAFRRLSEKQNKAQQLCDLGVSAVRLCFRPLEDQVEPPLV